MIPQWVNAYIDLPFSEYNCWELIRKVYADQRGIILPTFYDDYYNYRDTASIEKIFKREMARLQRVEDPRLFDLVALRIEGAPWHAAMVVAPGDMLHTEKTLNSVIERYTSRLWKHRVLGFYRWEDSHQDTKREKMMPPRHEDAKKSLKKTL